MEANPIIFWFYKIFGIELPHFDTMEQYLWYIRGKVRHLSDSIKNTAVITNKTWIEIRDTDDAHEIISHVFQPELEPLEIKAGREDTGYPYYKAIDGKMYKGNWTFLADGSFIIKWQKEWILYTPLFVNEDFLLLMTKGDKRVHNNRRLVFFAREGKVLQKYEWYDNLGRRGEPAPLEWRDVMELFFNIYRFNVFFIVTAIVFIIALIVIIYLSV